MASASLPPYQADLRAFLYLTLTSEWFRKVLAPTSEAITFVSRLLNSAHTTNSIVADVFKDLFIEVTIPRDGEWCTNQAAFEVQFGSLFQNIDAAILRLIEYLHEQFLNEDGTALQKWFHTTLADSALTAGVSKEWNRFMKAHPKGFIRQIHGAIFLHAAELVVNLPQATNPSYDFVIKMSLNRMSCLSMAFDLYSSSASDAGCFSPLALCFAAPYSLARTELAYFIEKSIRSYLDEDFERKVNVVQMCISPETLPSSPTAISYNPTALPTSPTVDAAAATATMAVNDFSSPRRERAVVAVALRNSPGYRELEAWRRLQHPTPDLAPTPLSTTAVVQVAIDELAQRMSLEPSLSPHRRSSIAAVRPPRRDTAVFASHTATSATAAATPV